MPFSRQGKRKTRRAMNGTAASTGEGVEPINAHHPKESHLACPISPAAARDLPLMHDRLPGDRRTPPHRPLEPTGADGIKRRAKTAPKAPSFYDQTERPFERATGRGQLETERLTACRTLTHPAAESATRPVQRYGNADPAAHAGSRACLWLFLTPLIVAPRPVSSFRLRLCVPWRGVVGCKACHRNSDDRDPADPHGSPASQQPAPAQFSPGPCGVTTKGKRMGRRRRRRNRPPLDFTIAVAASGGLGGADGDATVMRHFIKHTARGGGSSITTFARFLQPWPNPRGWAARKGAALAGHLPDPSSPCSPIAPSPLPSYFVIEAQAQPC